MNKFLQTFKERGFFHQATDEEGLAQLPNFSAYIGFDCTATTLHVGSLLQIMVLRLLKATGNKPIILLGGGTTKVGDPSGKDESRKILTQEDIEKNKAGIRKVFEQFSLGDCQFVDNAEWLDNLNYLDFLREVGRHFSVNRMIAKDSVKQRLERESHLSFLEFNYMILQGYDFVELNKRYACRVQIGGSDQWGNITEGVELNRRMFREKTIEPMKFKSTGADKYLFSYHNGSRMIDVDYTFATKDEAQAEFDEQKKLFNAELEKLDLFGVTTPLITTSSGAKMGKTAAGAVWLDAEMLSPYEYYQFWRNTDDADVIRFLKMFTELEVAEIDAMKEWEGSAKINDAKKVLAFEATKLCHGEAAATAAAETAVNAFEKGTTEGLPEVRVDCSIKKAFALFFAAGLADSFGDARRLIKGGGAKIDDIKVDDENQEFEPKKGMKLSAGKKKHVILDVFPEGFIASNEE